MGQTYPFSFTESRRAARMIKQPPIPNDYCTLVSIFPKEFRATILTCEPSEFYLPAGSLEKPSLLTIGSVSWWKDPGMEQPLLEIQVASFRVATSLINDNIGSMLSVKLGERQPGIFFLPGKKQINEIPKADLAKADMLQKNWYREMVRMADIDWARHNGNPLAISDDSRLAAQELGLKDQKAWMGDFRTIEMVSCIACGSLRNPKFPVCPSCHNIVDKELAAKLGIQKAS